MSSKSFIKDIGAIKSMVIAGQLWRQLFLELEEEIKVNGDVRLIFTKAENFFKKFNIVSSMSREPSYSEKNNGSKNANSIKKFSSPISLCRGENIIHCPVEECSGEPFHEGEYIRIDSALKYNGWNIDGARTFVIQPSGRSAVFPAGRKILDAGIKSCQSGADIREVVKAINDKASEMAYKISPIFCGHGIGREIHEEPRIGAYPNLCKKWLLKKGMTIALEFVAARELTGIRNEPGRHSLSCERDINAIHEEDTILVTDSDPIILTRDLSDRDKKRIKNWR